jgi:cyclophilin family peptidyl-prolyl cis-trans isomerase
MKLAIIILALAFVGATAVYLMIGSWGNLIFQESSQQDLVSNNPIIQVETSMGDFEIELYQNDAPKTVANFISLADKGFYNNLTFHRVVKGFVIQGGDPNGDGTGGPGYVFEDELNPNAKSYQEGYKKGTVAMANSGPNTNGSQWFVALEDLSQLPKAYTIFGKVIKGMEVVEKIGLVEVDVNDKPLSPVTIKKID